MTRTLVAAAVALLAVLAGVSLVLQDSFYSELGVRPEDAGASEWDSVVRGVVYLGLPVGAAGILCAGVLVAAERLSRDALKTAAKVVPVVAFLVAAGIAIGVAALMAPGALSFARGSVLRIVGGLIVVLAFATALAVLLAFARRETGPSVAQSWLTLAIIMIAAVPALTLARSAGVELADRARDGSLLEPGALDPLQVRAQPTCLLGPDAETATAPAKGFVLLGESTGGAVLYDRDERRAFVIAPTRLGVLSHSGDVCREPGAPTPLETGTPADDADLAKRFRPRLQFDSREPWRPLDVEGFVGETFPEEPNHHLVCTSAKSCKPLTSTADLNAAVASLDLRGHRNDGSDQKAPCATTGVLLDCETDASAIYYNVTRQDRRVYIDYWWFLRYNHFPLPVGPGGPCGGRPTPKSQHEGDWEGVTAVTKFGNPEALDFVAFASHTHTLRYRGLAPELDHGRPKVYVACGSHAGYPRPCARVRGCRQTSACSPNPCGTHRSRLAEAPSDGAAGWHRNDDKACFTGRPCLLPFPTVQPAAAGEAPSPTWTTWAGRWGVRGSPRSPGRQARFMRPWEAVLSDRTSFDPSTPGEAPVDP